MSSSCVAAASPSSNVQKRSADQMAGVIGSTIPVKVALRIRPLIDREITAGSKPVLEETPNPCQVQLGQHFFTFDHVFSSRVDHSEVYDRSVSGLVKGFIGGCNVTIFAYGQTGGGKTFTLGLSNTGLADSMPDGVVLRALTEFFKNVSGESEVAEHQLTLSVLEIYKEKLRDLLSETVEPLAIREDVGRIRVNGLSEHGVTSVGECVALFSRAAKRRTVGETMMNHESSRSHAIYTLSMKRWTTTTLVDEPKRARFDDPLAASLSYTTIDTVTCKLQIVDLAGSERCGRTHAQGSRFQEGIKINMGLLALGNVISLLGDEDTCHRHIPYRDSKLTRLLQDSLGGNSMTLMIACVSPSSDSAEETLNTLRYANRARNIKNKPVSNHQCRKGRVAELRAEIQQLKMQLALYANNTPAGGGSEEDKCPLKQTASWMDVRDVFDAVKQQLTNANLQDKDKNRFLVICNYLDKIMSRIMSEGLLEAEPVDWANMKECFAEETAAEATMTSPVKLTDDDEEEEEEEEEDEDIDVAKCLQGLIDCIVEDEDIGRHGVPWDIKYTNDMMTEKTSQKIGKLNDALRGKQHLLDQFREGKLEEDRTMYDATHKLLNEQIKELEDRRSSFGEPGRFVVTARSLKLEEEIRTLKAKLDEVQRKIADNDKAQHDYKKLKSEIQELKQERVLLVRELRLCMNRIHKMKAENERKKGRLRLQGVRNESKLNMLKREHLHKDTIIDRKRTEIFSTFMKLRAILDQRNLREQEALEDFKRANSGQQARRVRDWCDGEIKRFVDVERANKQLEELWRARQTLNDRLLSETASSSMENLTNNSSRPILRKLEGYSDEIANLQQVIDSAGDMDERMHRDLCRIRSIQEARIVFKHVFRKLVDCCVKHENLTRTAKEMDEELTLLRKQNDQNCSKREELERKCRSLMKDMIQKFVAVTLEKPDVVEEALVAVLNTDTELNTLTDDPPMPSQSRNDLLKQILRAVRKLISFEKRKAENSAAQTPQRSFTSSLLVLERPILTPTGCATPSGLPPFAYRIRQDLLNRRESSMLCDASNFRVSEMDQAFLEQSTKDGNIPDENIGHSPD